MNQTSKKQLIPINANIFTNIQLTKKLSVKEDQKFSYQRQNQLVSSIIQQQSKKKQQMSINQSILKRLKKRSFSLSKFGSIQQSQMAKTMKQGMFTPIFKPLNIQKQKNMSETNKNNNKQFDLNLNERFNNHPIRKMFNSNNKRHEGIILLKQIVKKKQQDLILNKQTYSNHASLSARQNIPNIKLTQQILDQHYISQKSQKNVNINSAQNNASKRIKLLKKSKDYQFYDNLVHHLLTQAKITSKNFNIFQEHQQQEEQNNDYENQMNSKRLSNSFKQLIKYNQNNLVQSMRKTSSTISNKNNNLNLIKNSTFYNKKRQNMIFRLSELSSDTVYDKKITSYIQFLYKVNYSNNIYVDLSLSTNNYQKIYVKPFKVKVDKGNNSQLIKSIVKRRFWLQLTNDKNQSNFVWTQLTQKTIHHKQKQQNLMQNFDNKTYQQNTYKPLLQQHKNTVRLQQNKQKQRQRNYETVNSQISNRQNRIKYSFKNRVVKSTYNQQSNLKILHQKDIQSANISFNRSYLGIKSPHVSKKIKLISNHIPNNCIIGSKKILWMLMQWYYKQIQKIDPYIYLPQTYHIIPGDKQNKGLKQFKQKQINKRNKIWIVKPGQNTNRGNGIQVSTTGEIQTLMKYKRFHKNGQLKTFIVQKYLKPFLYQHRKFDIRHYLLITSVNGLIKAYWYKDGYIRTSSQKFDLQQLQNQYIHLTNDAVQKQSQNYGKYQPGNKLSYTTFQRYLDSNYPQKRYNFRTQILDQMKKITRDVIRAGFMFMDPQRIGYNFQLYGMDFMIDHQFKPYLIQINANPCLQISCPLLQSLIPICVEHTFRLALDPLLPLNDHYAPSKRYQLSDRILDRLKYQLIFDQKYQGKYIRKKYKQTNSKFILNGQLLEPDEDFFQNDGEQFNNQDLFQHN